VEESAVGYCREQETDQKRTLNAIISEIEHTTTGIRAATQATEPLPERYKNCKSHMQFKGKTCILTPARSQNIHPMEMKISMVNYVQDINKCAVFHHSI
jgi:hypothetical protein